MYNPLSIIIGISILLLLSFGFTFSITLAYRKLAIKVKELELKRTALYSGALSLGWLLVMAVSIWVSSSISVWIFALVSFILLFSMFYIASTKAFGMKALNAIIYTIILACVLNPAWFVLLGVTR